MELQTQLQNSKQQQVVWEEVNDTIKERSEHTY